jgi:hypothetical protein
MGGIASELWRIALVDEYRRHRQTLSCIAFLT